MGYVATSKAKFSLPITFKINFDADRSYVVDGQQSDMLLAHEQLHLRIAEYTAAKATANFPAMMYAHEATDANSVTAAKIASDGALELLKIDLDTYYDKFTALDGKIQQRYDQETDHAVNSDAQPTWESNWQVYADGFIADAGWTA